MAFDQCWENRLQAEITNNVAAGSCNLEPSREISIAVGCESGDLSGLHLQFRSSRLPEHIGVAGPDTEWMLLGAIS